MKTWIPMLILFIACTTLIVWDGVHTSQVFDRLEIESKEIYTTLLTTEITDEDVKTKIIDLNDYWTKKMDTLCVSISRKDLQTISDYLQYLYASIINESQEDAITYSRLLSYNIEGIKEATGITGLNLL